MNRAEVRDLMERLDGDASRIAAHFSLSYRSIKPERADVKRRYGVCYSDGSIRIRLRHATSGRPLRYSSLVSTLCHELAHLRYFNHGARFQGFYRKLLRWARDEGIYRPRPQAERRPTDEASGATLRPGMRDAPAHSGLLPTDDSSRDDASSAPPHQLTLFS